MVERNNRYGYINQEGKEIVPIIYEHIDDFHEGLAPVKLNDKWGYVDCSGKVVIPPRYDDSWCFNESLAALRVDENGAL